MTRFKFNLYEERILRVMRAYYDSMVVNDIADQADIHWETTEKYLKKLKTKKVVKIVKIDGRDFWEAVRKEGD